jgi:steroid delta-isomerase-like uncharacterized protein
MCQSAPVVEEMLAAWNAHDVDRVLGFYTPDYEGQDVGEPGAQRGLPDVRASVDHYLRAFPDLHVTCEETIVEGDRLVVHWRAHGSHRGMLLHIPPTGREVTVRGVSLLTMRGDKLQRGVHVWDVAGLLRAVGLLPDL